MTKLSVVVCTFLLLVFQYSGTKAQALTSCNWDMAKPCVCTYQDPSTGKSMTVDISHYFKYPTDPKPDSDKYTYLFNPCENHKCEKTDTSGVACLYIKSQKRSVSLGRIVASNIWFINEMSASKFQFTIIYKNGDPTEVLSGGNRSAKVTFKYADTDMTMEVVSAQEHTYNMQVSGRLVKAQNHSSGGGGGGGGGGKGGVLAGIIGIVIMILAVVAIVSCFVIGGIYMYTRRGARKEKKSVLHSPSLPIHGWSHAYYQPLH